MGVDHPGIGLSIADLMREVRRVAKQTIQNASIGHAGIRVYDGGWIRIEGGGLSVTGSGVVSGTLSVSGQLNGNGTLVWTGPWTLAGNGTISGDVDGTGGLDWTGPAYLRGTTRVQGTFIVSGPTDVSGTFDVTGATKLAGPLNVTGLTTLNGDVTLNNDLTLGASGQITAGTVRINRFGSYGGQIVSTGAVLYLSAGASVIVGAEYLSTNKIEATDVKCFTLDTLGSKNFRMPHPTKPKTWLRHGATESPISGTEYTGRVTIADDGSAVVTLPEYFEALNKPDNRTVQITPVGRPFPVGADEVLDGKFTVYGDPGRDVFWLVKAERFGGDFLLEEPMAEPPYRDD